MKDQGGKKATHGSHEEKSHKKRSKQKQFLGSKINKNYECKYNLSLFQ